MEISKNWIEAFRNKLISKSYKHNINDSLTYEDAILFEESCFNEVMYNNYEKGYNYFINNIKERVKDFKNGYISFQDVYSEK
jgi:hypothetical protein